MTRGQLCLSLALLIGVVWLLLEPTGKCMWSPIMPYAAPLLQSVHKMDANSKWLRWLAIDSNNDRAWWLWISTPLIATAVAITHSAIAIGVELAKFNNVPEEAKHLANDILAAEEQLRVLKYFEKLKEIDAHRPKQ